MKLNTVQRAGDGTFHQTLMPILEEDMKLKCTLCVHEHGNAVKTDQLLLMVVKGVEVLACIKHWERITGRKYEPANNQPA